MANMPTILIVSTSMVFRAVVLEEEYHHKKLYVSLLAKLSGGQVHRSFLPLSWNTPDYGALVKDWQKSHIDQCLAALFATPSIEVYLQNRKSGYCGEDWLREPLQGC